MSATEAKEKIHQAMMKCNGVSVQPHRFGGFEYKLDNREIGHVHACVPERSTSACRHGDYLVDIPFPMKIRNEIIEIGEAQPHHVLPESGWVSVFLKQEKDIDTAIMLLKKSYDLAIEHSKKRIKASTG